jgi:hypothetical protein
MGPREITAFVFGIVLFGSMFFAIFWHAAKTFPNLKVRVGRWRLRSGLTAVLEEWCPWEDETLPWKGYIIMPDGSQRRHRWTSYGYLVAKGMRIYSWYELDKPLENPHSGSLFDDFLIEEGIDVDELIERARKRLDKGHHRG